ncbi:MAG: formamidopyrimidine-DNA glycosylase [Acidimicrobiia bacterium]|nr:formamidopyrimidine-DNA glycosylase [Acidimicrobiia bacterium]
MPEYPDIEVYIESLERHFAGTVLNRIRVQSISLLRTFDPPIDAVHGQKVQGFRRMGKRIVWVMEEELFIVLHLMVSGRLRMKEPGVAIPRKSGAAAFDFGHASLLLTEASSKKRASLQVIRGNEALSSVDPGGIEIFDIDVDGFGEVLTGVKHTVKRALTDAHLFSGIGNAYSDEILHRAKVSPFKRTGALTEDEIAAIFDATRQVLDQYTDALRQEVGDGFPDKVTAFRKDMIVHGKFGEECPVCGSPVQRIVYASNETNYCAGCQTGGKILADRSLSRLLKDDYPRRLEDLEG